MRKSEDRSLAVTTLHTTGMTTGPSEDTTTYPAEGPAETDWTRFFFRPTPSWLPPGRYTHSIAAKR